jgi:antitoxin component YwqK of YwqJK toxin-antitoxin module
MISAYLIGATKRIPYWSARNGSVSAAEMTKGAELRKKLGYDPTLQEVRLAIAGKWPPSKPYPQPTQPAQPAKNLRADQVELRTDNLVYEKGQKQAFTGTITTYYPSGKAETKTGWRNGRLHGEFVTFYESGRTKGKSTWQNGKLTKKTAWFLDDGSLDNYPPETAVQDPGAIFATNEPSDGIKSEDTIMDGNGILYSNKQPGVPYTGIVRSYFPGGAVESESSWRQGKLDGMVRSYYENGKPQSVSAWKDGVQLGETKEYDMNGNLVVAQPQAQPGTDSGSEARPETVSAFAPPHPTVEAQNASEGQSVSEIVPIVSETAATTAGDETTAQTSAPVTEQPEPVTTTATAAPGTVTSRADLETREGLAYAKEQETPYTGVFTEKDGEENILKTEYKDGALLYHEVSEIQTEKKDDLVYEKESATPVTGTVVTFRAGRRRAERNYKEGKLDGESKEFYNTGVLQRKSTWSNGVQIGETEEYNNAGQLKN